MGNNIPKEPKGLREERIRNSKPITRFFRNLKRYRRKRKVRLDET